MPLDPEAIDQRRAGWWCGRCPDCRQPLTVVKITEKARGTAPITIIRCRCGCTTRKKDTP